MFSKDDFASTNLRNDMRMKNEILQLIEDRKGELEPLYVQGQRRCMKSQEIYGKVLNYRHYLRSLSKMPIKKASNVEVLEDDHDGDEDKQKGDTPREVCSKTCTYVFYNLEMQTLFKKIAFIMLYSLCFFVVVT